MAATTLCNTDEHSYYEFDIWRVLCVQANDFAVDHAGYSGKRLAVAIADSPGFIAACYISTDALFGYVYMVLDKLQPNQPRAIKHTAAKTIVENTKRKHQLPMHIPDNDKVGFAALCDY